METTEHIGRPITNFMEFYGVNQEFRNISWNRNNKCHVNKSSFGRDIYDSQ
jgi:hypothetical protein